MVSLMIVVINEPLDLFLKVAGQLEIFAFRNQFLLDCKGLTLDMKPPPCPPACIAE
jgi:hypothetical protein